MEGVLSKRHNYIIYINLQFSLKKISYAIYWKKIFYSSEEPYFQNVWHRNQSLPKSSSNVGKGLSYYSRPISKSSLPMHSVCWPPPPPPHHSVKTLTVTEDDGSQKDGGGGITGRMFFSSFPWRQFLVPRGLEQSFLFIRGWPLIPHTEVEHYHYDTTIYSTAASLLHTGKSTGKSSGNKLYCLLVIRWRSAWYSTDILFTLYWLAPHVPCWHSAGSLL